MKKAVTLGADLSIDERNLLSISFKNLVGLRRTSWRAMVAIEQKEEQKQSKNLGQLKTYKEKIEKEL